MRQYEPCEGLRGHCGGGEMKKMKCFLIVIIIIMLNSYPLTALGADEIDPWIKIGLASGAGAQSGCTLLSENGFTLGTVDAGGFAEKTPLPSHIQQLTAVSSGADIALYAGGAVLVENLSSDICVFPNDYAKGGMISCEGLPYRGGFMFISGNNGAVGVVNILRTEEYLYGVLSLEIGRGSPIEALKAQAVAARSFAAANMSKHADEGFNLCSSTHCQLYRGYSAEYEETNRAVDETAQRKLYYGGQAVGGYYFKNSGGHTRGADEAWGGIGAGYLLGAADEYSPDYTWNFAISTAAFRKALESAGHVTGDIISVALNRNPGSGFVSEALINGAENTASLKGETMRTVLGANNIKSMNFTLGNSASNAGNTESVVARIAEPEDIHLAGAYEMERLPEKVYIISGGGEASRIDSSSLYMRGAPGAEASDSANAGAEIFMPGEILNFSGKGYGHGVGMPQDSAVEMALQGFSYTDILNKYYTGAEIK